MPFDTRREGIPRYRETPYSAPRQERPPLEAGEYLVVIVDIQEPFKDRKGREWIVVVFEEVTLNGSRGGGAKLFVACQSGVPAKGDARGEGVWLEFLDAIQAPEGEALTAEQFKGCPLRIKLVPGRQQCFVRRLLAAHGNDLDRSTQYWIQHHGH